ncbi:MAG: hypothetical protein ACE5IY_01830 [bacterium]
MLDEPKLLGDFALNFRYFKIAINEYDKDELLKIRNIVSSLFLAESFYETGLLKEELIRLFENQEDKQAVSLFLNWFKQLAHSGRRDDIDYEALERIYKSKEEVRSMLEAAIERERKGWKDEGKREGIRDVAQNMLARGMEISVIADLTGLSEEEIVKLKMRNQG